MEAGWVTVGQILAFVGGVIGIKLLTNLMPPDRYGELALGISLAGMVNMFVFGPLGQVVLRFHPVCREQGKLDAYIRVLIRLHGQAVLVAAVLSLPVLIFVDFVFGGSWARLFGVAIAFAISSGFQGSLLSLFTALRNRRTVALAQTGDVWLRFGCAAALVFWVASDGAWALGGYLVSSLVVAAWLLRVAGRWRSWRDTMVHDDSADRDLRKEFMAYGLPFVAFAGLGAVSQYADRWLLQGFQSESAVGVYAAMVQIASAPVVLVMAVATQLIVPVVFSRAGDMLDRDRLRNGHRLLRRAVLVVSSLYLMLTLAAYFWGDTMMRWMTHADYTRHTGTLWIIVLAVALFNLAQFMVASGLTLKRPIAYLWPKLAQAVALLSAGTLLVPDSGILGMALALLISSVLYLALISVVNFKLHRENALKASTVG